MSCVELDCLRSFAVTAVSYGTCVFSDTHFYTDIYYGLWQVLITSTSESQWSVVLQHFISHHMICQN